jgi:DNA-binding Lrp family transcriptional regulator
MTFEPKYSNEDILKVLDTQNPKTVTVLAKEIGCSRSTVLRFLDTLEREGLAREVSITGSSNRAWVKALDTYEKEGTVDKEGYAFVGKKYAGKRYRITVFKD